MDLHHKSAALPCVFYLSPWFVVFFSVRSEGKRREAEERQVVLVQEKNDLALQLQAVSLKLKGTIPDFGNPLEPIYTWYCTVYISSPDLDELMLMQL